METPIQIAIREFEGMQTNHPRSEAQRAESNAFKYAVMFLTHLLPKEKELILESHLEGQEYSDSPSQYGSREEAHNYFNKKFNKHLNHAK